MTNVVNLGKDDVMKSEKYKSIPDPEDDIVSDVLVGYTNISASQQYLLIERIQKGISYKSFANLIRQSPFTITEWSSFLHLTDRTLLRYKAGNKTFEGIYAEKVIELTMFIKKGIDTFQTKDRFSEWLHGGNVALGGYKPIDLLVTSVGIELVTRELIRIDYGILA